MINRSSVLSFLLVFSLGFVLWKTHQFWKEGPEKLRPHAPVETVAEKESETTPSQQRLPNVKEIIGKNLFDPDRGASKVAEAKADEVSAVAIQRFRRMTLLGTAIFGESRYAILRDRAVARPPQKRQEGQQSFRVKLGDVFEGFRVSEIDERKIVLSQGNQRIELSLSYFGRLDDKTEATRPRPSEPGAVRPAPRRDRLPAPPQS
jgi:hypothetical protein